MMKTNNNPSFNGRRIPSEWEPCKAILMAWPHEETDWAPMLEEVRLCVCSIIEAASHHAEVILIAPDPHATQEYIGGMGLDIAPGMLRIVGYTTNDTWARDFGPITAIDADGHPTLLDFKFNGWGLKFAADKDNLATGFLHTTGVLSERYENNLNFVLEGGSIESDGRGTILTTSHCLLSPNRNGEYDRQQIEYQLRMRLGADRILWLDHGDLIGDDTDSHIDTLARLAPNDTIFYVKSYDLNDIHTAELELMEQQLQQFKTPEGNSYNLVGLPLPDPIHDIVDGVEERLPATYANYLVVNDAVLLPVYNQMHKDRLAMQMLRIAYPAHEIIPIDCRPLIKQHGSLHCMTMQLI